MTRHMVAWFAALVGACVLAGSVALYSSPSNAVDAAPIAVQTRADAISAVFRINGNCSATAVDLDPDKTLFLTAAHCIVNKIGNVQKIGMVEYEYRVNGKLIVYSQFVYEVVKLGTGTTDLALIQLRAKVEGIKGVKIAEKLRVDEGDDVWAVGYPYGSVRTITQGIFNGLQNLNEIAGAVFYRASAPITFGNSGGALFQEAEGGGFELIGVTSMKYQGSEFMNLFVPLDVVRVFLGLQKPQVVEIPPIRYYEFG